MLEIQHNGSKWYGQVPDSIEELLTMLATHPLDRTFEDYGNFINLATPDRYEHYDRSVKAKEWCQAGCTHFNGNFATYSHAFSVYTNEPAIVDALTTAIRANQQRPDYLSQITRRMALDLIRTAARTGDMSAAHRISCENGIAPSAYADAVALGQREALTVGRPEPAPIPLAPALETPGPQTQLTFDLAAAGVH